MYTRVSVRTTWVPVRSILSYAAVRGHDTGWLLGLASEKQRFGFPSSSEAVHEAIHGVTLPGLHSLALAFDEPLEHVGVRVTGLDAPFDGFLVNPVAHADAFHLQPVPSIDEHVLQQARLR